MAVSLTVAFTYACAWQAPSICACGREHFRAAPLCEVCGEAQSKRQTAAAKQRWAKQWRGQIRGERIRERLGVQAP